MDKMDKKIEVTQAGYDALCGSIDYYKGCDGTQPHFFETCPSCKQAGHPGPNACLTICPIGRYTGQTACDETPWSEWYDEWNNSNRTYVNAAIEQEEVKFLEKVKDCCIVIDEEPVYPLTQVFRELHSSNNFYIFTVGNGKCRLNNLKSRFCLSGIEVDINDRGYRLSDFGDFAQKNLIPVAGKLATIL